MIIIKVQMKKKFISIILLIFFCSLINTEEVFYFMQDISPDAGIEVTKNKIIKFNDYGTPFKSYSTKYYYYKEYGINYLEFDYDYEFRESSNYLNKFFTKGKKKWLILYCKGYMFAYNSDYSEPIFGCFLGMNSYDFPNLNEKVQFLLTLIGLYGYFPACDPHRY